MNRDGATIKFAFCNPAVTLARYRFQSFGASIPRTALNQEITDRKSTRLNSSHSQISYAVFCLKKKNHSIASPESGFRLPESSTQSPPPDCIARVFSPNAGRELLPHGVPTRWPRSVPTLTQQTF